MDLDELITKNMPFVHYLINKYYPRYRNDDDIIQCGMLGLVKACQRYDPTKGKLSTYADKYIRHEINAELRNRHKNDCVISLEEFLKEGKRGKLNG